MRKCSVCKHEFEHYVPIEQKYLLSSTGKNPELLNREEYSCPYCYSPDRDRMIVCFLEMIHANLNKGLDILEIAPSGALTRYIHKYWGECNLYTADLFMEDVDYQVDIQNLWNIQSESFDFVVCSHVLEHVEDDVKAIKELHRVLEKNGLGIIIVPLDLYRQETDEEWGLTPQENLVRFGQEDHVRAYNKNDYIRRLEAGGFFVHQLDKAFFGDRVFQDNALMDTSVLYLVYKNGERYASQDCLVDSFCEAMNLGLQYNYWIDVCELRGNKLYLWGWAYLIDHNSRLTKLKVVFEGNKRYVFGAVMRKREDIQNTFGNSDRNYLWSGIDVLCEVDDLDEGCYAIKLELHTKGEKVQFIIKDSIQIRK